MENLLPGMRQMSLQVTNSTIWNVWKEGNYYRAGTLLTAALRSHPNEYVYSHYLGLVYVLQKKSDKAQETWKLGQSSVDYKVSLLSTLDDEANILEKQESYLLALRVRQAIQEIDFDNVNNYLRQILLLIQQDELTESNISYLTNLVKQNQTQDSSQPINIDFCLLKEVVQQLFSYDLEMRSLPELVTLVINLTNESEYWIELLKPKIEALICRENNHLAVNYTRLCLELDSEDIELIRQATSLFYQTRSVTEAKAMGEKLAQKSHDLLDQLLSNMVLFNASQSVDDTWEKSNILLQKQITLLENLIKNPDVLGLYDLTKDRHLRLIKYSLFMQPYADDQPAIHHNLRRQVGNAIQARLLLYLSEIKETYQPVVSGKHIASNYQDRKRKIRVGYIGQYLRRHSVGWIARWLFMNHDRERFEIYTYFNQRAKFQDFSRDCFANFSDSWHILTDNTVETAKKIQEDKIDILVDVDSLTSGSTYGVMALKPAPVQVTWLGWDASGLSAVDYFIADPYVLPDDAQNYYTEKIWRLPQSFVAVRGFEVDFPIHRREKLNIPTDAIVYFSNQNSIKRNDAFVRVQMQVIRRVPNSYFLIKVRGDSQQVFKDYFESIAQLEGVNPDRLRFLPLARTESLYRGNLPLADVVLDSYPYGGATTTLETLWAGLPLVTRVGEQFQARNSYSMLINAGIEEGIAWTDDEYVEWAVKFGTDESLRKRVFNKLMRSRQTAPLWNAKQFTRQMEDAYQQMWAAYLESR